MTTRRSAWKWIQLVLTAAVVGFAAWYLWNQWTAATENGYRFDFEVEWLAAASLVILTAFLVIFYFPYMGT